MKTRSLLPASILVLGAPCSAQWAVIDAANLSQSITNYAALVEQIAKEAEQISNQIHQIQQMQDQLDRLGKMADIKSIVGFAEFRLDLDLPTRIKLWAETTAKVDGFGIFGDTRDGIFRPVLNEFPDFEGGVLVRDSEIYKPAHEITTMVDEFKEVQADAYARREELRKAIARTSEALQAAETDAEEKKLEAILNAQYSQLAALDSEVALSAAEIQVRAAESVAMTDAQNEADAEARRKLAQQEAEKVTATFTPSYESILLYVKETPYTP
ncbi:hypothetical protein [Opitutus terrae]|uniref:Outer membrane protein-like protein n=1 Tax=Opitutus terrae (strain DSM 11246 / JCM 15787 / PB90-1) TaxID=452637 RepID=B1ZPG9_OPITP|nr:hypothetical protein [Opitutus terrae]ACB74488.1 hypothetical protein Oter_1202 [Opitutus terrae PB90-1]